MRWCRTIPGFVRALIALFLIAQFSGVAPAPRASAQALPDPVATQIHHQHGHDHGATGMPHDHGNAGTMHDHNGNLADACCALHAYFAGILPPVIAIKTAEAVGETLALGPDDLGLGIAPGRLDRPPRPPR